MSALEKLGYAMAFMVPLAMMAAMLIPSWLPLEQRINWERHMDNIILGIIGIFCWFILFICPVLACIAGICVVWFGEPKP